MTRKHEAHPTHEHSVPWFWPMAAAIEFEEKGLEGRCQKNLACDGAGG